MPTLIDAFLGARDRRNVATSNDGGAGARASGSFEAMLEAILAELFARGNAAHLDLRFNAALFAAHLGRCGAPVQTLPAAQIHAEDLFLAAAALHGDHEAAAKLRRLYRPAIAGALVSIDTSASFIDDVEQRLWVAALVCSDGAPP